ncbi:MAG: gamma-glutamylcyclotransferase family protein [bacterium]
MNRHFIFIYGSLRRGTAGSMSLRFPQSKFIAEANVNGRLYDLGPYPGLLLDESNSLVNGEVYEVDDHLLSELDEFEASSNYVRKPVEIFFSAQRARCWTYEPNPEFYRLEKLITSGDWVEYARAKTHRPDDISPNEES